jgi:hypothetical protein
MALGMKSKVLDQFTIFKNTLLLIEFNTLISDDYLRTRFQFFIQISCKKYINNRT